MRNELVLATFNQSIDDSATATPPVESLVLDVLDDVAATVTSGAATLASAALLLLKVGPIGELSARNPNSQSAVSLVRISFQSETSRVAYQSNQFYSDGNIFN